MSDLARLSENIDEGLLGLTGDAETELWRVVWPHEASDVFYSREEAEAWLWRFPPDYQGSVQKRTIHEQYTATEWSAVSP